MKKVGIVACSNGQTEEYKSQHEELTEFFRSLDMEITVSDYIYEKESVFPGNVEERADALMKLFRDKEIEEIYDVSGGEIANGVLDYLDFDVIKESKATFWGFSDLTTIVNAIYTLTGKESVLYQVKNMVRGEHKEEKKARFIHREELFDPKFDFISGDKIEGVVVGGNIRCFLKLAGTRYFPDLTGKVLLLESLGGEVPLMAACLSQLKQLGAFEKISGILLGTFTTMERNACTPDICELVQRYAGGLPIAKTAEIGHSSNSKAIVIGKEISLFK